MRANDGNSFAFQVTAIWRQAQIEKLRIVSLCRGSGEAALSGKRTEFEASSI